jgi:hypothetical protein
MNEADTDQSQDHYEQMQAWVQEYQEYWDQVEFPQEPVGTIMIEVPGKCVGRDKKPVPADDVWRLASLGCKDIEIAEWFGIDPNTLRYNFSVELLKGRETLRQSLRRKQIEVAMTGNPTMLIFLGKNLLGQSDSPLASQEKMPLPWTDDQ